MQHCARFTEYLIEVCAQIRWQKSHDVISKELLNHLEDQKDAFLTAGLSENEAEQKAVEEMGNPVEIGTALDHAYRPKTDWSLLLFTAVLLVTGIVFRYLPAGYASLNFTVTDGIGIFGLIIALLAAYFMDFSAFQKYTKYIYSGFILVFIALLLLSPHRNGRSPYAPYLLLLFPLIFSGIVYHMRGKKIVGILYCGFSALIPIFLGLYTPSRSGVFISAVSVIIILTYAIIMNWFGSGRAHKALGLLTVYSSVFIIIGIIAVSFYRQVSYRIGLMMNPLPYSYGPGYVAVIIRKVLGSASLIGKGAVVQSIPEIPDVHSDYLLIYLINEFGWITFAFIMLLLGLLVLRGVQICRRQRSFFGRLVCVSILSSFSLQCFCYLVSNLGFSLTDEFPFPLLSGNVSMIINLFLIGVMLSVFRNGCLVTDNMDANTHAKWLELSDGKLVINFRGK